MRSSVRLGRDAPRATVGGLVGETATRPRAPPPCQRDDDISFDLISRRNVESARARRGCARGGGSLITARDARARGCGRFGWIIPSVSSRWRRVTDGADADGRDAGAAAGKRRARSSVLPSRVRRVRRSRRQSPRHEPSHCTLLRASG